MIKKGGLFAAAALVVLLATSHSFSFVPQSQQRCPSALNAEQDSSQESTTSVSSRRGFFSQVAATASASLLLSSSPQQATAASDELPTRIELSVDTEYMIQALDYFDGDMRKVIEVLIRAPSTEVEIEPPASTLFDAGPKDAILSALASYTEDPEYAARQASWIKVDKPNRTLDFLLKKRYDLSVPSAGPKSAQEIEIVLKDGGTLKYKPMKLDTTPFSLSNLEAGVGLAVVSYPIAYGVYNYDSWKEEKDKKEKKAQMAAKKAAKAKAKAAAAKAKAKGTPKKKEKKEAKDDTAKKFVKQVMKGEEKKSPKVDNAPVDVNFDGKSEEWFLSEATLKAAIEKPKPSADASVDTSNESEWFGRDVSESKIVALVEEAETILMQEIAQQGGYLDNLSPPTSKGQVTSKKQVAAKKREYKKSGSFGSYLDSL
eukprot:CAMPEP_0113389808 /NCGR_PEP_ID=MMETSP0013_2-20120614/9823_1 /TAXON_ID=2843 ORGANISM="Skeletonema costatum, Strain 1716" /NCGR_SAMPLE_ID=MMETSP0013_2 /ASSEMBLY_ACC=CAM_ASM_000158 /LENGTH=428 /DNA_ID=CAMNT_0000272907 /DNA_START=87 /DNA_END=1376 /DNA_ORIENTATION=+ /assembly_acc=CAM_ASM_000158